MSPELILKHGCSEEGHASVGGWSDMGRSKQYNEMEVDILLLKKTRIDHYNTFQYQNF